MKIIDGKKIADKIALELKERIDQLGYEPKMTVIQVGDLPASNKYVDLKLKRAWSINVDAKALKIEETISQEHLEVIIKEEIELSDGLIIQLPLPDHIEKQVILDLVPFDKDIDGLATGNNQVTPATPKGIMTMLRRSGYSVKGKTVSIVGRSKLVGLPVTKLCLEAGATVVPHNRDVGLTNMECSDFIISAAGQANLIKKENVKIGAVIIDVGTNPITLPDGKTILVGDVDVSSVSGSVEALSPVPGGVGPMTVISLLENLVELVEKNKSKTI